MRRLQHAQTCLGSRARLVRNARRAAKLRKRGVPIGRVHLPFASGKLWIWYESEVGYIQRTVESRIRKALRRKVRLHRDAAGLQWVEALLEDVLAPMWDSLE